MGCLLYKDYNITQLTLSMKTPVLIPANDSIRMMWRPQNQTISYSYKKMNRFRGIFNENLR